VRGDLTDAAEPAAGGFDLPFEHRIDIRQPQIGKADDADADPGLAAAPVGLLSDPADKLALTNAAHLFRAAGAIARAALYKDGRDDVVS
jgi:hypothetical protein